MAKTKTKAFNDNGFILKIGIFYLGIGNAIEKYKSFSLVRLEN